ncbi:MAG TPA: UDP-2,3-diacylglucosamine diphosphatase [Luteimonas sp.]
MTTLLISDLHLDPARAGITRLFGAFVEREARAADALYILGDLFEAWVGDDDPSETGAFVADRLAALSASGVPVYFMHGNRDFLLGPDYARRAGMTLLDDPTRVRLYGQDVLLMHGDTLCTDDLAYQQFRAQTRDARWQQGFLAQPLAARMAFAQQARAASQARQGALRESGEMETITDVAPDAVAAAFEAHGVDTIIHGHTHRPAVHALDAGGRPRRRIVLGDWYEQGSVLRVDAGGMRLERLDQPSPPQEPR